MMSAQQQQQHHHQQQQQQKDWLHTAKGSKQRTQAALA
jgi:hypothetical protein